MARCTWWRIGIASVFVSMVLAGTVLQTSVAQAAPSVSSVTLSPDNANDNVLNGVSCTSRMFCVAVGYHVTKKGVSKTLVESWNGTTWSIVSAPDKGSGANTLNGVSCTSSTFCVAVGDYSSYGYDTLVETWNGSHWSITPSPGEDRYTDLYGVSCTSSNFCEAVGYYTNPHMHGTLVETWNGTTWSIVSTPDKGSEANTLNGVSCTSDLFCVAVGYHNNSSNVARNLVETWNGSQWSVAPTSDKGSGANTLNGVSCKSSTFCVAVGDYSAYGYYTLVETWNGLHWSITPSPGEDRYTDLYGVSCTSSNFCEAVGYYTNPHVQGTLVETWDGSSWSITPSPDPSVSGTGYRGVNSLSGVSCTSALFCEAAGFYNNSSNVARNLVETWNGSQWSVATTPDKGSGANTLNGV